MQKFLAKRALLPDGWANNVMLTVDDTGFIQSVDANAHDDAAQKIDGSIIPSMPNLHSHAFQRAFAGKSEYASATQDSFWTWRKLMYSFLETLDAEELEDIATKLYIEMRQAGFNHVGEFHYIHHRPDGQPYDDPAHLSHVMIRAAKKAGIGITILPVLYAYSGFGAQPPEDGQKRFINNAEQYLNIISTLHDSYSNDAMVYVGAAFHSLRAVSGEMIKEVSAALNQINPNMPIHIHIAEQQKEVDDCLAWSGKRPVEWLMENVDVNSNWCLVHATHMNDTETKAVAKSGAVAGLCPITEANLGDGLFNIETYIEHDGAWGIGSDSHIAINMLEELRLIEYGQRLLRQQRAICRSSTQPHVGDYLYHSALRGGAQALGIKAGRLDTGYRADFLVLGDDKHIEDSILLDSLIFAGNVNINAHYICGQKT